MQSGNYTLNHGLANTDADEVVEAALTSCDADNKFCDDEVNSSISCVTELSLKFDIELAENAEGDSMRVPDEGHFINDGLDATDIAQGGLGDCWFLCERRDVIRVSPAAMASLFSFPMFSIRSISRIRRKFSILSFR